MGGGRTRDTKTKEESAEGETKGSLGAARGLKGTCREQRGGETQLKKKAGAGGGYTKGRRGGGENKKDS